MPELNTAPEDTSIAGTEGLLTTAFQHITVDDLGTYLGASNTVTVITEGSAFTATPASHAGRNRLVLAGGDVTFNSAQSYASGQVYSIRSTAAIELVETGVTLTPPAGGTLFLDPDMAVTVVMTSGTAGVVIGQTVAAS